MARHIIAFSRPEAQSGDGEAEIEIRNSADLFFTEFPAMHVEGYTHARKSRSHLTACGVSD
ncbi:hypothetical protein BZM27_41655 [Paraburkholderia steynii]|uniref:Uncharacterized protein n=1 Tax=Paraburkholderia steynii TaxID=1245441 RepID=A0A4R0XC18_9BURK|nr:hypothetical protein BZM27_41655 [Paraburkholderia steynii]